MAKMRATDLLGMAAMLFLATCGGPTFGLLWKWTEGRADLVAVHLLSGLLAIAIPALVIWTAGSVYGLGGRK